MHLVVNPGKVSNGGSLTDTTEFVIDGTVAKADPTLVSTKIRNWDATKMGANSRGADDGRVTGIRNGGLGFLVELS